MRELIRKITKFLRRAAPQVLRAVCSTPKAWANPADAYPAGWSVGVFDPQYYRARYPDVAAAGTPLFEHYTKNSVAEGRFANELEEVAPLFDRAFYLAAYPDVAAAGIEPIEHFFRSGVYENRQPNPFFEPRYYRFHYPTSINPASIP